jgi:hypothetical protein
MTFLGVFGIAEIFFILIASLFFLLIPLFALIDIVRSKFEGNMQLIWVIIVVFFNVIGSILYFIIGRNQKVMR